MSSPRPSGCAAVRVEHAEPLHATAPERASSWLLVEHPGPWPAKGLPGDLPPAAREVVDRAAAAGVRPQLVRPVADRRRGTSTVVLASCRPGASWLERRTLHDLDELADLDVDALARGARPGFGLPSTEPVVLVCTHGKRDVCCARLGRPLAVLLDRQLPGLVWETNHLGGDRFAANVVTLPGGSYHGGVGLADVPALAEAVQHDAVLLDRFRGRAGTPGAVQAADHFVREATGATGLDAVRLVAATTSPSGETCVEVLVGVARWCVHVVLQESPVERLTTCSSGGSSTRPASWALAGLRRLS